MDKVTVKRDVLLAKIKENKELHVKEYELARKNYPLKVKEMVDKFAADSMKLAENGKQIGYCTMLQLPVSHEKDYITSIEMLEYSIDDEITISQEDFKKLVQDDFDWKEVFVATTNFYNK